MQPLLTPLAEFTMLRFLACTLHKSIVFHVQPPEVWDGGVGFVSKEMIQTHCPAPAADIQVISSLEHGTIWLFLGESLKVSHLASKSITDTGCSFQVLRCGPPPMNKAMAAHLDDIGYTKEMQFQF